jgi:acetyl esterase
MPLDPQCDAVLQAMASMGMPPLEQMTPEVGRSIFTPEGFAMLMGAPEDVAGVSEIQIPGPDGPIPAVIYTPAGSGPFPVVVYFHGGGWVLGSAALTDATCRMLANRSGAVVLNVDYRLAPEDPYPAAVNDAYAATKWAAENGSALNGDGRVAVAGDSAGGNLAAVVALMARDRGGPEIALQALIYPVTDHTSEQASHKENAEGYLLTADAMKMFWGHYIADEKQRAEPYASPLRAPDLSGVAPAAVFTCEFDPLRDEGEEYAERLRAAGVSTTTKRYDGAIHGIFWMPAVTAVGVQIMDDVSSALKSGFTT